MVYAIQIDLAFQNTARRDTVASNIITRIGQLTTWGPVLRNDYVSPSGNPAVQIEVRFTTVAEQNTAWNDIINFVGSGINGPVSGSFLTRHNCPHDETVRSNCVIAERIDY
jgi:hypothetical protein